MSSLVKLHWVCGLDFCLKFLWWLYSQHNLVWVTFWIVFHAIHQHLSHFFWMLHPVKVLSVCPPTSLLLDNIWHWPCQGLCNLWQKISDINMLCFLGAWCFTILFQFHSTNIVLHDGIFSYHVPLHLKKYLVHMICGMASSTPINSTFVELFVFDFCFLEKILTTPLPSEIIAPHFPWSL